MKDDLESKKYARYVASSYDVTMDDGWRNDFCETVEDGERADEERRTDMIADVMRILDCSEEEAEDFYNER